MNNKMNNSTNKFIYSRSFVLKALLLDQAQICPEEISSLNIDIQNKPLEMEHEQRRNQEINNRIGRRWIRGIQQAHVQTEILKRTTNMWNNQPPDIKRITGILNKLNSENYDEAKTFNYSAPEVVSVIFKKAVAEPFFSDLYAKFCYDLNELHTFIFELCADEFAKNRHKNLGKFIGELFKLQLISDLNIFVDVLLNDLIETNLEILCKIMITINIKDPMFTDIVLHLDSLKHDFKPRYKFMIQDLVESSVND